MFCLQRVRREEHERVEMEKRIAAEEAEEAARGPEPEPMPDMNEIASQYEPETYDQYSRKVVPGGRVLVKKPGKRVEMSRTRLKYLQRKNKSLQVDMGEEEGSAPALGVIQGSESADAVTKTSVRLLYRQYFILNTIGCFA